MPGDRVALMLPTGTDFFSAFFGILYVGAVPVPIYPPMQRAQIEDYVRLQAGILRNAGARMLITVREGLIPNPIDQNPWAHWRSPMDMMRQG